MPAAVRSSYHQQIVPHLFSICGVIPACLITSSPHLGTEATWRRARYPYVWWIPDSELGKKFTRA